MWKHVGTIRPPFAESPGAGQESVWDYPRPPAVVADSRSVLVSHRGIVIARSQRTRRVLETASPPVFYIPPEDVDRDRLVAAPGGSSCEWKGRARYWGLEGDAGRVAVVGWSYERPLPAFSGIAGWISFYPGQVACTVGGESVRPQEGGFYGGWVTDEIVGPWKGAPGTGHW